MSSLCHRPHWSIHSRCWLTLATGALLIADPVLAAEVYVQPLASVEAQTSSNVQLDTDPTQVEQVDGYFADAAMVIGVATPESDTTVRPRLRYRYYPDRSDLDKLEAFLDLTTRHDTQRGHFTMFGRYEHRDEVQAERSAAEFNDITPPSPTTPESGHARVGATRDLVLLLPTYLYDVTQRVGIGASATLQAADYSPDDPSSHVDFRYYEGKGFARWSLTQRSDVSVGGFGSKYSATNYDSDTTSYGISTDIETNWSQILDSALRLSYQHSDIQRTEPTVFEDSTNGWSAILETTYKGQLSRLQTSLGRSITPSGGGGLYNSDNVRMQYEYDLTERLEFTTAARYLHNHALSKDIGNNDREYTRAELGLKWKFAPTWYLEAGYEYTWQKYKLDPSSAEDNSFAIRFGYEGLPRQR